MCERVEHATLVPNAQIPCHRCRQHTLNSMAHAHATNNANPIHKVSRSGPLLVNGQSTHGHANGTADPRSCVRESLPCVRGGGPVSTVHGLPGNPTRATRGRNTVAPSTAPQGGGVASLRRRLFLTRARTAATADRLAEEGLDQRRPPSARDVRREASSPRCHRTCARGHENGAAAVSKVEVVTTCGGAGNVGPEGWEPAFKHSGSARSAHRHAREDARKRLGEGVKRSPRFAVKRGLS